MLCCITTLAIALVPHMVNAANRFQADSLVRLYRALAYWGTGIISYVFIYNYHILDCSIWKA